MLMLSMLKDEEVFLTMDTPEGPIETRIILAKTGAQVRLGFDAPLEVKILRGKFRGKSNPAERGKKRVS